ncbi:MAG: CHASE domain-containing protein [Actinobacteria bacterium]|nr:CHASE domain-containing protein [Actinomycetota bacterium]
MPFFRSGGLSRKVFRLGVWAVVAIGITSSAAAMRVIGNAEAAKTRDRTDEQIEQSMARLGTAVGLYASVLNDAAALFAASNAVTRAEFSRFYERAAIGARAEGLQGLGFIQRVSAEDLAAFVGAQRADGAPDFAIVPVSAAPEHAVITFNEPAARFSKSWGYDLAQIREARVALDRARDSGKPALTSRLVLVADRGLPPALQPAAFVLYAPIYAGGGIPATVAERRASLVGWANGPFRAGDFLTGAMRGTPFEVSMYEGSASTQRNLMATVGNRDGNGYITTRVLAVYGQRWTFTFRTTASARPWRSAPTAAAGVIGLLATGLLLQLLVTIRRTGEQSLAASERVTQEILGQTIDAFVAIDHRGCVVMWNAEAERLFGWRAAEVMGSPLTDSIIPEESHHAHRSGVANLSAGGPSSIIGQRVEVEARHRDGTRIPIELSLWESTYRGEPAFSAFLHDISDRRRHAEEIAEARDKALEATAAKSLFLANVSHEIRTPMSGVLGVTKLLRETPLTPLQLRYVDAALASSTSLLSILNDLLDAA